MRSQSLSVLLGVKVNASLHFLVSLCLSLTLSLCISLSLFASLSLCISFPPYVLLSVCLSVCLSLWLCLLVFLVSLHKFVSSQKCGEIVVSLCVCVSVSPAPLPISLWVALGASRRRLWARLDLCALCALAQKCDAMHCKCPGQPSAPAVHRPPASLLPTSLTYSHTHTRTYSLVVYTIKRKAC